MSDAKSLIRKAYTIGNKSIVVAIAPPLVRKFEIDEATFFEEVETAEGILLKPRRLT